VPRIVVVGAGVAGLAAGVQLADLGHEVTVLEQSPTIGGALGTFSRDGYTFDTGEPALTLPAVYRHLFRTTGAALEQCVGLVPVEPSIRFQFADGLVVNLPNANRARMIPELDGALGNGTARQWDALLRSGEQIWRSIRGPLLDRPPKGSERVRLAQQLFSLRSVGAGSSLRAWAQRAVPNLRLRAMLECQARWTGADPRQAPAVLAVLPYLEHAFGTWYVTGGMHRLTVALAERAAQCGATVLTSADVVEILLADGRVCGVRLADGAQASAQIVVAAMHAARLYGELCAPPRKEQRRLARAMLPPSIFTLLVALRGRTPIIAHRTVLLPEDPDAELDWLATSDPGPPPSLTVHICAPGDPSMHPVDGQAWAVHVRVPRHSGARPPTGDGRTPGTLDWDTAGFAESFADWLLGVLAVRGLDVRDQLLWRIAYTPADRERATRAPGGAVGGFAPTDLRHSLSIESSVRGLYLVGASTHPGSGLPFVARSATFAADLIGRAPAIRPRTI
jgi:phytoene desaturase